MSQEMAQAIKKIGEEWAEFKEGLQRERAELATKGYVTQETTALVKRIDDALQEAVDRKEELERISSSVERIEAALARSPRGGADVVTLTAEEEKHREALQAYMRYGTGTDELRALEQQALTRGTDPSGGYWVTEERRATIVTKIFETSPMRQVAAVDSISTDAWLAPDDYDEAGAAWASEQSTRSETTTPAIGQIRIPVHEMYAMPKASQQLIEDAEIDPESWLAGKVGSRFGRLANTAFISGTGAGQPRGILTPTKTEDDGTGVARGSVGFVKTGVSGDWKANTPGDNLIDLMYRLKMGYHANASFIINRTLLGEVRKFATSTYAYVWEPSFQAGQPPNILGAPVVMMEDMPAKAANSYSVGFGDWAQAYQIVDRVGISVLRDPFTAKPFVLFYTRMRVGGDVVNYEAFKLLKFIN
jgi:HK97 family phage major capsid protein